MTGHHLKCSHCREMFLASTKQRQRAKSGLFVYCDRKCAARARALLEENRSHRPRYGLYDQDNEWTQDDSREFGAQEIYNARKTR